MSADVSAMTSNMTGGEVAGLIAAVAFAVLAVVIVFVVLLPISKTIRSTTKAIQDTTARAGVMLDNVNTTVEHVNTALVKSHLTLDEVNAQLVRVDTMTEHAQQVTGNVANLTTLVSAAATNPLVKLAAFGFGVRRAAAKRRDADDERDIREAMTGKKKSRKQRRAGRG